MFIKAMRIILASAFLLLSVSVTCFAGTNDPSAGQNTFVVDLNDPWTLAMAVILLFIIVVVISLLLRLRHVEFELRQFGPIKARTLFNQFGGVIHIFSRDGKDWWKFIPSDAFPVAVTKEDVHRDFQYRNAMNFPEEPTDKASSTETSAEPA